MTKGRVVVYSCGGAGLNIGHRFEQHREANSSGFATVEVVYIDTSKSNLKPGIDQQHLYHIEGKDGSGKLRNENAAEITKRCLDILHKYEPGDLNIVLSSTGGGSGSVIAPSLASELLNRQIPVIAFAVGGADTRKEIENTLNTIKSYEGVSAARKAPMVVWYMQNSPSTPRSVVDKQIEENIYSLLLLYSRENQEMDSKDLINWLNYTKVTTYKPALTSLTITTGDDPMTELGDIISIATIGKHGEDTSLTIMPEVQFTGYVSDSENNAMGLLPKHYVLSDGLFPNIVKGLNDILNGLKKAEKARLTRDAILSADDDVQDNGLVL